MAYLMALVIVSAVAIAWLFKTILAQEALLITLYHEQNLPESAEHFDYSRAHRLVMERVHIDEMDPDISQYLANEAWKSRLSDYKQQYYATVKNHDISYQHSGQRVDLNAIQQNPNVVMLRPYDRQ